MKVPAIKHSDTADADIKEKRKLYKAMQSGGKKEEYLAAKF